MNLRLSLACFEAMKRFKLKSIATWYSNLFNDDYYVLDDLKFSFEYGEI